MAHVHQGLLDAIAQFADGYGKDERYKSVLEGLQGAVSGLNGMGPAGDGAAATPGQLAAKLAADPEAAPARPAPKRPEAAEDQPKNFADASALAKERMAAA